MPTLFTRIINGEIPGRFIWKDDLCVAFLTIAPISPGHTLVVPRTEVDHWFEVDPQLFGHCMEVAQKIGSALSEGFKPTRVVQLIAGFEVPHLHVHVLGADSEQEVSFANADPSVSPEELDRHAETMRQALINQGFSDQVPKD